MVKESCWRPLGAPCLFRWDNRLTTAPKEPQMSAPAPAAAPAAAAFAAPHAASRHWHGIRLLLLLLL